MNLINSVHVQQGKARYPSHTHTHMAWARRAGRLHCTYCGEVASSCLNLTALEMNPTQSPLLFLLPAPSSSHLPEPTTRPPSQGVSTLASQSSRIHHVSVHIATCLESPPCCAPSTSTLGPAALAQLIHMPYHTMPLPIPLRSTR
jgi:hypothetical protein